ncbi:MAG TPA: hypothetical protein VF921_07980 [Vicinamibacterales bacterium]
MRSRVVLFAAVACLTGYVYAYTAGRAGTPIRSDAYSYYVYLPAWFLYHDPSLEAVADDCCGGEFPAWTAIIRWPVSHHWVDAHPIGEAILIAPFFGIAHALTRWSNLSPDGFTPYYQHAAGLAGLFYVVTGLWFLRRLLSRHFSARVTDASLLALLFGTSLFHYATFDSAWSHAFSFALCAALLDRLDAWQPGRTRDDIVIGVLTGLLILVRHTNLLVPLCFVAAVRSRRLAITTIGIAGLVVLPQLWLYHRATGHWLVSSYGQLGFTFAAPHLWGVLGSPTKGVFFWAPLLLVAVAGFAWLPASLRRWRVPAVVMLVVDTYIISSWWDWQFGASYGHRGFVDVYPVLALGLASAFDRAAGVPRHRLVLTVAVVTLCALSVFQMLQYWHGVLPMSDMTWPKYRSVFLRGWW